MDVKAYLKRINYAGSLEPTRETLRNLHVAHLLAVPFENLSIHLRQPIVLDDAALFTKIVERQRGGFCYELNGLFASLLRALGFRVTMLSAGVANQEGGFGPPFDHMALMVSLQERWLADVGFGDSFREPLLMDDTSEQAQEEHAYRIAQDGLQRILMQRESNEEGGEWKAQYRFSLEAYEFGDFEQMCLYHQTSPESPFTKRRVCSRATPEGRVTLSEMRLIKTIRGSERQERVLTDKEEYRAALTEHFRINLDDQASRLK